MQCKMMSKPHIQPNRYALTSTRVGSIKPRDRSMVLGEYSRGKRDRFPELRGLVMLVGSCWLGARRVDTSVSRRVE
jgi:hypothetical protein